MNRPYTPVAGSYAQGYQSPEGGPRSGGYGTPLPNSGAEAWQPSEQGWAQAGDSYRTTEYPAPHQRARQYAPRFGEMALHDTRQPEPEPAAVWMLRQQGRQAAIQERTLVSARERARRRQEAAEWQRLLADNPAQAPVEPPQQLFREPIPAARFLQGKWVAPTTGAPVRPRQHPPLVADGPAQPPVLHGDQRARQTLRPLPSQPRRAYADGRPLHQGLYGASQMYTRWPTQADHIERKQPQEPRNRTLGIVRMFKNLWSRPKANGRREPDIATVTTRPLAPQEPDFLPNGRINPTGGLAQARKREERYLAPDGETARHLTATAAKAAQRTDALSAYYQRRGLSS